MKKFLLTSVIAGYFFTNALQVNAQEVGVRFGNTVGNDVALDVVFLNAKATRIHADVSFGNGVGVDLLWDFIFRPLNVQNFHWYIGAGPTIYFHDPFFLGVSGEIGLEFRFPDAPIALGIDWRPTFYLIEDTDFESDGFGFNARYVIGSK